MQHMAAPTLCNVEHAQLVNVSEHEVDSGDVQ